MNRKINLVYNESQNIKELENVPINNVESIFSYSCEILICRSFNIFDESIAAQALSVLFDKIRPQGQLIIGVIDYKQLCYDYIHKKIDNIQFFSYMSTAHNHYGLEDVIEYFESLQNSIILDTKSDQYLNFITIVKTKP